MPRASRPAFFFPSAICGFFLLLCSMSAASFAADLNAIYAQARQTAEAQGISTAHFPQLALDSDADWTMGRTSSAYSVNGADGSSSLHFLASWASQANDAEAAFILSHELSHALCGHVDKLTRLISASDPSQKTAQTFATFFMEYEADALATRFATLMGYKPYNGANDAFGDDPEADDHPSGALRLRAIRKVSTAYSHAPENMAVLVRECSARPYQSYLPT